MLKNTTCLSQWYRHGTCPKEHVILVMYQIIIMLPSDTIPYRGMVFFEL